MTLTGKNRSTKTETCPSATLSTTDPKLTDLGSNQYLRGERKATNHLSHGRASLACTVDTTTHSSSKNTPPPGPGTISYRWGSDRCWLSEWQRAHREAALRGKTRRHLVLLQQAVRIATTACSL